MNLPPAQIIIYRADLWQAMFAGFSAIAKTTRHKDKEVSREQALTEFGLWLSELTAPNENALCICNHEIAVKDDTKELVVITTPTKFRDYGKKKLSLKRAG